MRDYIFLALRNISQRGIRTWLTLLGIIIGIAAVVALITLGQGLETAITGQFSVLSTDRLVVTNVETGFGPPGSTSIKKLNEHDLKLIQSVRGVDRVISRLIRVARVEYNEMTRFEYIGSLPESQDDLDYLYDSFSMEASFGRLPETSDHGRVLFGSDFSDKDRFGKDIRIGSSLIIQGQEFEVVGILKKMSSFQFNGAIFMFEKDMEDILDIKDEMDLIVVQVQDEKRIEQVAEDITRKMRRDRNIDEGEEDFSVETPIKALDAVQTILNIINIVVAGIAAISLLIGTVGVANTMFTSVVERTKQIGIMKSVGAKNQAILIIFIIEAALLGLIGGILGSALGLAFAFLASGAANQFLGSEIFTLDISLLFLGSTVLFSTILGIAAGVIPSWQASRLHPVEALRK